MSDVVVIIVGILVLVGILAVCSILIVGVCRSVCID